MIHVQNTSAISTPIAIAATGSIIPFDTVLRNTNWMLGLSSNTIQLKAPGYFDSECVITIQNPGASSVTVMLDLYAGGVSVTGASSSVTIPAAGTVTLGLPWIINVVEAQSGTANINWFLSGGAVNLTNAFATVYRMN